MIHNLIVTLEGLGAGDTATANSLMEAWMFPGDGRTLGEYDDAFVREGGVWRFASRCYTILRLAD